MGDRQRTDGSGARWCAGYPRATVHQVTAANVPANEYVPEITENGRARDHLQTIERLISINEKKQKHNE